MSKTSIEHRYLPLHACFKLSHCLSKSENTLDIQNSSCDNLGLPCSIQMCGNVGAEHQHTCLVTDFQRA